MLYIYNNIEMLKWDAWVKMKLNFQIPNWGGVEVESQKLTKILCKIKLNLLKFYNNNSIFSSFIFDFSFTNTSEKFQMGL